MSKSRSAGSFLKELYKIWLTERPGQFAASLAYYTLFSFVPVVYIALSFAGIFVNQSQLVQRLLSQIGKSLGEEAALALQAAVVALAESRGGGSNLSAIIGFVALLFAASMMFFQMQYALNTIWQVPPATRGETLAYVKNRLLALVMVFGAGILMVLASGMAVVMSFVASLVKVDLALPLSTLIMVLVLVTVCLAMIYKLLPNARVTWRDVWIGSVVTAVLIVVGGYLLGAYLSISSFGSAMGAAASVAVFLIAFYFFGQIFMFGAVFTRVFASLYGSKIVPVVAGDTEEN